MTTLNNWSTNLASTYGYIKMQDMFIHELSSREVTDLMKIFALDKNIDQEKKHQVQLVSE